MTIIIVWRPLEFTEAELDGINTWAFEGVGSWRRLRNKFLLLLIDPTRIGSSMESDFASSACC